MADDPADIGVRPEIGVRMEAARPWRSPLDARAVAAVLAAIGDSLAERGRALPSGVELHILDDAAVAEINLLRLGCAGPTNILSFPGDTETPGVLLLSLDALFRECRLHRQEPRNHLLRLLAHGMAHLAGMDHGPEMSAAERAGRAAAGERLRKPAG